MKSSHRKILLLLTLILALALLTGCRFSFALGPGSWISGESYPHAEAYRTGSFSCSADAVTAVEIDWRSGAVEIVESDRAELNVRESGSGLPEDAAMHYSLENGTLRIRFCASGARIRVRDSDKRLTVEVPQGIALCVQTTSAPISADTLTQHSILLSARSGGIQLGTVSADRIDLSTSSGGIRLGTVSADSIDLSASSGGIQTERMDARTLSCHTSSGSLRLGVLTVDTAALDTSSGAVAAELDAVAQLDVRTSSGRTQLSLPGSGAEVAYTAGSGRLHTARAYERKGDLYVFGGGEARITVVSGSGNLELR